MKCRFALLFVGYFLCSTLQPQQMWPQTKPAPNSARVQSVERKLQHVESNAAMPNPDPTPTEFTEEEINAYFSSGNFVFPAGVQSLVLEEQPGVIVGTARIDFDQIKAGKNSYNPLLSVFSGLHEVVVSTHAHGEHGQGLVHVDSVMLDGVVLPDFVLELFVQKYLKPKYPNIGIDSHFALPARAETATVGLHKVSLSQK
jgi:hypothetical protein